MQAALKSISIHNSELVFVITEYLLLLSEVANGAGTLYWAIAARHRRVEA
jgi:hypothetical protein